MSSRSVVMATGGMVATSQPLAGQVGLRVLQEGGNAADAAVATAAALNVVEPTAIGIGGDVFALNYEAATGEVTALNGSGRAAAGQTLEWMRKRGHGAMPTYGGATVTVPGAVAAWADLLARHGTMPFSRLLPPAIRLAENGFPVSERIAALWRRLETRAAEFPSLASAYLPGGRAPRAGEIFRNPALAASLRMVADGGAAAFYGGPIASEVVRVVAAGGGCLMAADLEGHRSTWDEPISTDYRGVTVLECPPNGQGLVALEALNILEGFQLGKRTKIDITIPEIAYGSADYYHVLAESLKLAFADGLAYLADPALVDVPLAGLLDKGYASARRREMRLDRATASPLTGLPRGGTAYLAVVDGGRNACSFIGSNYMGFGSGLAAAGFALQNRGALFSLDEEHPNVLAPGKRPYHTIMPGMALRDGRLWLVFGVMGGFVQPQAHVQVISHLVDYGMNVQQAMDAPRLVWHAGQVLDLEDGIGDDVRRELAARGHLLMAVDDTRRQYGGGQIIAVDSANGVLLGGSDPRKDGAAVGYG